MKLAKSSHAPPYPNSFTTDLHLIIPSLSLSIISEVEASSNQTQFLLLRLLRFQLPR